MRCFSLAGGEAAKEKGAGIMVRGSWLLLLFICRNTVLQLMMTLFACCRPIPAATVT